MTTGADTKANTLWGGGAPERGHGAPLERLAQLGDALSGVSALTLIIEAAELVVIQAAKGKRGVSMGADRKANTWGVAAHSNEVTALPLSPSHSAMMPSVVTTNSPESLS